MIKIGTYYLTGKLNFYTKFPISKVFRIFIRYFARIMQISHFHVF